MCAEVEARVRRRGGGDWRYNPTGGRGECGSAKWRPGRENSHGPDFAEFLMHLQPIEFGADLPNDQSRVGKPPARGAKFADAIFADF